MNFNMVQCLDAFSLALDFVAMDYYKVALHHSRKVAYISLNIGRALNLPEEDIKDLYTLSLLHDNGLTAAGLKYDDFELVESSGEHCMEGEENITHFPLNTSRKNIILFHHENYDGTGIFNVEGNNIPVLSQIIHLADRLDVTFDLSQLASQKRKDVIDYVSVNKNTLFSPEAVDAFFLFSHKERFWSDLSFYDINEVLRRIAPEITYDYSCYNIVPITETFMKIIDSKSKFTFRHSKGISEKIDEMSDYYKFDSEKKLKMHIAANLHDLGKLFISNAILDKPGKLDEYEFNEMKKHTYFTKLALQKIDCFGELSNWAANHHEKLNGKGYPENLNSDGLDFESRLMGVIDIYQALVEERPYRKGLSHEKAVKILDNMADSNFIDGRIVRDVDIQHLV